jgi:hypothetical protein
MTVAIPLHPDAGLGLALAVVGASSIPLLLLDGRLIVAAASASFCNAFGLAHADVKGREVFSLGAGEWDVPQLRSLLKNTISGAIEIDEYEMDLLRAGEAPSRLILNARRLD